MIRINFGKVKRSPKEVQKRLKRRECGKKAMPMT
jgi:hypothetical protein